MKKIYPILCGLLLALLLFVGLFSLFDIDATYSERERRSLKTLPGLTISSLLDGSYTAKFSEYYADTFPNRESLMDTNRTLNGFYYFSGGSNTLVVDRNNGAADHGENLGGSTPSQEATTPSDTSGEEATVPSESTAPPLEEAPDVEGVVEQLGAVALIGDRALDIPYADNDQIKAYAAAVTKIAAALGSNVRTFSMPVPNSAAYYSPAEYRTGASSQTAMLELVQDSLGSNVHFVDSYSAIAPHTDEYLYFRTDHHWTQLGAYYAYTAFCQAAGFTAPSLDTFETGQWDDFVGSLYTSISDYPQSQVLLDNPDTVYYYKPSVDCTTTYYSDTTLSDPVPIGAISYVGETSNKYLTFMGGDHPITIIDTGNSGSTCILIKESFGNCFAPWLINNYSKVICIDPREFNRDGTPTLDLPSFAQEHGVTDCIILNYPMMLSSEAYTTWLERLVD
ncbi:MAG TPA: hypothetical protein IAC31_08940 [Candidatus Faecousia intestinigallinarum]|nr:hypothetical protein [Candidatus Faecousia intestinigallinarum]